MPGRSAPGTKIHMNLVWNESSNNDGSVENSGVAAITGIRVGF